MRSRRRAEVLVLTAAVVLVGCVGPPRRAGGGPETGGPAALEARLEELSASVEELSRRVEELAARTDALAEELSRARRTAPLAPVELPPPPAPAGESRPAPQPMSDFEVKSISLGMLTGATNWDDQPGDDGVVVYLYPLDQTGDIVKRAGDFTFELFDLERSENPLIMRWHIPAAEAARYWQTFPGCYRFKLAWQGPPPRTDRPILKATFITLAGQTFTVTKRLRVERAKVEEETP